MFFVLIESLSFTETGRKQVQTRTRGKLHHTQTSTLDRSATRTKLKKGFKKLFGLFAALYINSWIGEQYCFFDVTIWLVVASATVVIVCSRRPLSARDYLDS